MKNLSAYKLLFLKFVGKSFVISGLFFALFCLFEFYVNVRSAHELKSILSQRVAQGLPISWEQVVPPSVPDEENFCSTPLLVSAMGKPMAQSITEKGKNGSYEIQKLSDIAREIKKVETEFHLKPPSHSLARKTDFPLWQKGFAHRKVFSAAPLEASPAQTVLSGLNLYENTFALLHDAASRPEARFPVEYDIPNRMALPLPQLGTCLTVSPVVCLQASALLKTGRSAEAWKDLQIVLKFRQALQKEPMIISSLVDITITNMVLDVIWEGLADQSWSSAELRQISETLGHFDYIRQYQTIMNTDFVGFLMTFINEVEKDPAQFGKNADFDSLAGSSQISKGSDDISPSTFYVQFWPESTYTKARVTAWKLLYGDVLPAADPSNHRMRPDLAKKLDGKLKRLFPYSPANQILIMAFPSAESSSRKFGEVQADVDMAHIACELEMFYHKNGNYPDSLPELGQILPRDIVDGNPYHYRKESKGRYELWSIGWNQRDDGGKAVITNDKFDRNQGDWVWRYPES